jgi:hypothetical protein
MIKKEEYIKAKALVNEYEREQLNIPVVSNSLQEMIALKEYYECIAETYTGGCYNHSQADANRKIKVLEEKIKEVSDNYC